jgi:Protein of unknown function (DUF4240)
MRGRNGSFLLTYFGYKVGKRKMPTIKYLHHKKLGNNMNEQQFWQVFDEVNNAANGDMDVKCQLIEEKVAQLSGADAIAFSYLFSEKMAAAYSWKLWAAAYLINGGCGDDSFMDFRSSLIAQGQAIFEQALQDPDSLAAVETDEDYDWCYEGVQYAVNDGVEAAVGDTVLREVSLDSEPSGDAWDEEDLADLLPKLAAKYS